MLSAFAVKFDMEIIHLYLDKGHTMMEVSALENYFHAPIYPPAEYIARIQMARPEHPYHINHLTYEFFCNYETTICTLSSIRPGKMTGDPVVVDIRQLRYTPDGEIRYTLDYSDEWKLIPARRPYFKSFNRNCHSRVPSMSIFNN
jgi:hypothetical protein